MVKVTELYLHPLKSAKPIRVKSIEINEFGVVNDRRWMIITQDNRYQGLKHNPMIGLINVALDDKHLTLSAEKMPELKIPLHSDDEETQTPFKVELFKCTCEVVDEGKEASKWLNEFLVPAEKRECTIKTCEKFH